MKNISATVAGLVAIMAIGAGCTACNKRPDVTATNPTRMVTLTNTVNVTKTNFVTTTNTVTVTNVVVVTETNVVAVTVVGRPPAQAAPATAPAAAVSAPAPAPTTTGSINNHVVAVVTTPTNEMAVVFYGSPAAVTNPSVGMVDGLPVLINNVSRKTVTLTLKRIVGRGSITLDVNNNSAPVISLLTGQYACTWRIKGRTEVAGSCTLTVSKGDPADLVVGQGTYTATLTLADE